MIDDTPTAMDVKVAAQKLDTAARQTVIDYVHEAEATIGSHKYMVGFAFLFGCLIGAALVKVI